KVDSSFTDRKATPASGSEFDPATWRSTLARLGRLDLIRRSLPDYSDPNATKVRQALAGEIFEVLRQVTGAQDVATAYKTPTSSDYKAIRYLAQLAVNIVDYMDNDDVSTPFVVPGTATTAGAGDVVFGFEQPRLVLNEVYAQYDNDKQYVQMNMVTVGGKYAISVWCGLMNQLPEDTVSTKDGSVNLDSFATLTKGGTNLYQLVLTDDTAVTPLRDPGNTRGDPDYDPANPTQPIVPT